MAAGVLVDSSFYIDRLRAGEDPFEELAEFADDFDFATCGVVMVEVLRGVKLVQAHRKMSELFECMVYVPTLNHIWERVAKLAWELDRKGFCVRVPDLTIAACALDVDAIVLTLDSDFSYVPGLRRVRNLESLR